MTTHDNSDQPAPPEPGRQAGAPDPMSPPASRREEPAAQEGWGSFLRQLLILVLVVVGIRTFIVEPFTIPSASMVPTLQIGDFIAVTKYSYGYSRYSFPFSLPLFSGRIFGRQPERGDVVVFRYTQNPDVDYIKRTIGLPGDHIRLEHGRLFINDREVPREKVGPYALTDETGRLLSGTVYREILPRPPGVWPHLIMQMTDEGPANNTQEYIVPPGCLFMMGDDRDDSADSRFQGGRESGSCAAPAGNDFLRGSNQDLGFVPEENLVGRARRVIFSINLTHPGWQFWYWPAEIRWNRTFMFIQ
nr:signal peptidase I [Oecophyllibacter saccharovorans]